MIARDEIEAYIDDNRAIIEILYKNIIHDVFTNDLDSWSRYPNLEINKNFNKLSKIDLILYSHVIDSFIEYMSKQE